MCLNTKKEIKWSCEKSGKRKITKSISELFTKREKEIQNTNKKYGETEIGDYMAIGRRLR
jgi:hypothetical protein